jgi:hypothetical protein
MEDDILILRKEPLLQFQFSENGFQFVDDSEDNSSRFFEYSKVLKLEARQKSTNWWLTIGGFITDILFQVGGDEINEDGRQIRFRYNKSAVILLLNNCDWIHILKVKQFIFSKL